jgi:dienelactone hydrolase
MATSRRNLFAASVTASLLCLLLIGAAAQNSTASAPAFTESEISFKAEDGWMIYGTLSIPASVKVGEKVPAVLLIHSPAHDRDIYRGQHQVGVNSFARQSLRSALGNVITLRIDIRGRGKSAEPQEYHTFTPDERARVALDISGAIAFLSRHAQIDSGRIGVVAEGASTEAAVNGAFRDQRVRAMALLSGRINDATKELIASRADLPLLCLVSKEDKTGLVEMADAYSRSRHPLSDLLLFRDIGTGNSMFIMWANKNPDEKPLEVTVGEWLAARLKDSSGAREVSFQTEDGWTLYGSYRPPQGNAQTNIPGVILIHSYLTDRHVFDDLEQRLSAAGMAVLNFDFRGRGRSQGKGTYFDLPQPERDKAYLDVKAATDFLAMQKGIGADRIAIVASSIGVKYGLKAGAMDARIRSFVMLGGMPDRPDVEKARFPILFVASQGLPPITQAFREFYKLHKDRGSQLLEYEGGSVGYQLFELDKSIEPLIVRWLKPQLTIP